MSELADSGRPSAEVLAEDINRKIHYAVDQLGYPSPALGKIDWQEYILPGDYGPYDRRVVIRASYYESEAVVIENDTGRTVSRLFIYPNVAGACDCFESGSHLETLWQKMLDDAVRDAIKASKHHKK